ncbi:MAG: M48 family metallopeptidase [Bacteroidales bacterium]|nr:M48 family metallopeptidase [Bacteroidales bacterium]MBK7627657.1 M48 family metallopeptidase [Bacteroidales bacterium]
MDNIIFYLIIIIPVAGFIIERYLDHLNSKMWSENLPLKLKGICDEEEYRKSQLYQKENNTLSLWTSSFNLVIILVMIIAGGFAMVDGLARSFTMNIVLISLIFFGIIGFASDIINIPFSYYDTFVIEKKYGFNTMSVRTFITDHIKSWFIALLVGAPVLGLITWFYYKSGPNFWLYAWGLITLFSVFINLFYSELIVPLFNKQVPLEEGSLRTAIEAFANKTGFKLKNIYIIDGSKRSTKANAYFSGFGPKKRIVLYDTLHKELTEEEIVAVLAHEIGHYRKKHVLITLLFSVILTGLMLFLFSLMVNNPALSEALGSRTTSFHMGLIVFGILYSPLSLLIGLLTNYISRKNEYAADRFVKEYFKSEILAVALKKLSVKNLSNMMPHPAYVFFHYSHPPLLSRLEKLD